MISLVNEDFPKNLFVDLSKCPEYSDEEFLHVLINSPNLSVDVCFELDYHVIPLGYKDKNLSNSEKIDAAIRLYGSVEPKKYKSLHFTFHTTTIKNKKEVKKNEN